MIVVISLRYDVALTIVSKNRWEVDLKKANTIVTKRPAGLGIDYERNYERSSV